MAQEYIFSESLNRIDKECNSPSIEESEWIPSIEHQKQNCTYIVHATSMYIHVEFETESISEEETTIIATFIQEVIQIINRHECCQDVVTFGTDILIIYNTPFKMNIEEALSDAASIRSLGMIISQKSTEKGLPKIKTYIGLDFGKISMIPVNFHMSDSLRHTWYGRPISRIQLYSNRENKNDDSIIISNRIWKNLDKNSQVFFKPSDCYTNAYSGSIVNIMMNKWLKEKQHG